MTLQHSMSKHFLNDIKRDKDKQSFNKTTFISRHNRSMLSKVLFVVCVDFFDGEPSPMF